MIRAPAAAARSTSTATARSAEPACRLLRTRRPRMGASLFQVGAEASEMHGGAGRLAEGAAARPLAPVAPWASGPSRPAVAVSAPVKGGRSCKARNRAGRRLEDVGHPWPCRSPPAPARVARGRALQASPFVVCLVAPGAVQRVSVLAPGMRLARDAARVPPGRPRRVESGPPPGSLLLTPEGSRRQSGTSPAGSAPEPRTEPTLRQSNCAGRSPGERAAWWTGAHPLQAAAAP